MIKMDAERYESIIGKLRTIDSNNRSRPGLYALALIGMMASCNNSSQLSEIEDQISELEPKNVVELVTNANTVGKEGGDAYFLVNGHKAYIEIDGMPIEQYVAQGDTLETQLE